jgi:hypothetical protein
MRLSHDSNLNVSPSGNYDITWDALYDKAWNTLAGLPAGLGLDVAFDGSDSTLTALETGVWWMDFGGGAGTPLQNGMRVEMGIYGSGGSLGPFVAGQRPNYRAAVMLYEGEEVDARWATITDGTGTYNVTPHLLVVRLA